MPESAGAYAGGGRLSGRPFAAPVAAAVNHLLRSAAWARERLKPFAGKAVQFDVTPFTLTLVIGENGEVAADDAEPAAHFKLTAALAMRVALADATAWREVETSGDLSLAREILAIAQNLRWDFEEDLSRVFGDIIAHRLAGAGRAFVRWQRESAEGLARQASAYWTEERPLIASRPLIDQFSRDVDTLRDDVARIDKRIEQLEQRRQD